VTRPRPLSLLLLLLAAVCALLVTAAASDAGAASSKSSARACSASVTKARKTARHKTKLAAGHRKAQQQRRARARSVVRAAVIRKVACPPAKKKQPVTPPATTTTTTTPAATTPTTTTPTATTPVDTPPTATTPVTPPLPTPPVVQPPANPPASDSGPLYWGAWIGSHLTGSEAPWDDTAMNLFEQHAGRKMTLLNFSSPFADCGRKPCSYFQFPASLFTKLRGRGIIPFFSWANNAFGTAADQSSFRLADVISGRHDAYIRQWATAAKAWGHPFFLRFNWEMNGNWFPWSEGQNGNQAGEYVTAWRHVHDIFTQVGATNATWTWCPNIDPDRIMKPLASLYPGDAYVDWTCLDGYNWNTPRRSFADLFRSTYREITQQVAPGKPMIIGETGSTEAGGSKAAWISDLFSSLATEFPRVRAFMYFNKQDDGMDWPIETSAAATAAFRSGITAPRFAADTSGQPDGLVPVQPATQ